MKPFKDREQLEAELTEAKAYIKELEDFIKNPKVTRKDVVNKFNVNLRYEIAAPNNLIKFVILENVDTYTYNSEEFKEYNKFVLSSFGKLIANTIVLKKGNK